MIDLKAIGTRIKNLREHRGWTQDQLAAELNVSRQAVSKWEVGASLPDADCLVHLARIFTTTVDEILTGDADTKADMKGEPDSDQGDYGNDYTYDYAAPDDDPAESTDLDIDMVVGLAPLVGRKTLDTMLASIPPSEFESWHLMSLGPFAGGKALTKIVRNLPAGRLDEGALQSLRAFVDSDALSEYAMKSSLG